MKSLLWRLQPLTGNKSVLSVSLRKSPHLRLLLLLLLLQPWTVCSRLLNLIITTSSLHLVRLDAAAQIQSGWKKSVASTLFLSCSFIPSFMHSYFYIFIANVPTEGLMKVLFNIIAWFEFWIERFLCAFVILSIAQTVKVVLLFLTCWLFSKVIWRWYRKKELIRKCEFILQLIRLRRKKWSDNVSVY